MTAKNRTSTHKRRLLLWGTLLFLLVGSFAVYKLQFTKPANNGNDAVPEAAAEKINLDPPTEEDKERVDSHKEELVRQQESQQTNSGSVKPVITDAGQYDQEIEVRAFVPGIFESGGNCVVAFTKGSQNVSKQVPAVSEATTTRCSKLSVPRSEFPSTGTWSVTVAYKSVANSGTSDSKTLEVK